MPTRANTKSDHDEKCDARQMSRKVEVLAVQIAEVRKLVLQLTKGRTPVTRKEVSTHE